MCILKRMLYDLFDKHISWLGCIELSLLYQVAYVRNGNTGAKKQQIRKNISGKKEKYDLLHTAEYHSLPI